MTPAFRLMDKLKKLPHWTQCWLVALLVMALFAPALSGKLPLVFISDSQMYFPAFFPKTQIDQQNPADIPWKEKDGWALWPLWSHDPDFRSPGEKPYEAPSFQHPFGTDQSGRDVLARMIYGTRQTLLFSGIGLIVALGIGVLLGAWAGSTSRGIRIKWTAIIGGILGGIFWLTVEDWASPFLYVWFPWLGGWLGQSIPKVKTITLHPDSWLTPLSAVLTAFPRLIFLLILSAWFSPGLLLLAAFIGGLSWAGTFRMVRTITQTWYGGTEKQTLDGLGIPLFRQWMKHIWPNLWQVLLPGVAASLGSFILLEATLGFLQIPLPEAHYGWGSLLTQAKRNPDAWWLVVFPGIFLVLSLWTVYRWKKNPETD